MNLRSRTTFQLNTSTAWQNKKSSTGVNQSTFGWQTLESKQWGKMWTRNDGGCVAACCDLIFTAWQTKGQAERCSCFLRLLPNSTDVQWHVKGFQFAAHTKLGFNLSHGGLTSQTIMSPGINQQTYLTISQSGSHSMITRIAIRCRIPILNNFPPGKGRTSVRISSAFPITHTMQQIRQLQRCGVSSLLLFLSATTGSLTGSTSCCIVFTIWCWWHQLG